MLPIIGVIVGIAAVAAAPAEFYQSRYDHLDVESILNNRRMVNYYAACLLSKGPCTPQGVDLKRILPEALSTNCAKCTEKQKTLAYRTIKRLQKEYPKIWVQLHQEWDPDDVYVPKFEMNFENQNSVNSDPPAIFNRFGDDSDSQSEIAPFTPPTTTTSTTIRTTTTLTTKPTKTTNKPIVNRPIFVTKPPQAPPFTTVGANLQATVSFGTNLVGGIVRSLSTLGTKVVESGTKLANMVISAALRT